MQASHGGTGQMVRYASLAAVIAASGIPLYIHLPAFLAFEVKDIGFVINILVIPLVGGCWRGVPLSSPGWHSRPNP